MLSVIDALGFHEPLTRRGDARENRSDLPRNKLADFVHLVVDLLLRLSDVGAAGAREVGVLLR